MDFGVGQRLRFASTASLPQRSEVALVALVEDTSTDESGESLFSSEMIIIFWLCLPLSCRGAGSAALVHASSLCGPSAKVSRDMATSLLGMLWIFIKNGCKTKSTTNRCWRVRTYSHWLIWVTALRLFAKCAPCLSRPMIYFCSSL
jgi:hypothetical protein